MFPNLCFSLKLVFVIIVCASGRVCSDGASLRTALKWEEVNASSFSTNERSLRYAYPLKIAQSEYKRVRNIELPESGIVYVSIPFNPYVDRDINQSSVIDLFGAVIGFRYAKPKMGAEGVEGEEATEWCVYDEGEKTNGPWKSAMFFSRTVVVHPNSTTNRPPNIHYFSQGSKSSKSAIKSVSASALGKAARSPTRAIEVAIDMDKGEWFFVSRRTEKRYKLAPTAREKSIRIYSGAGSIAFPKVITFTSAPLLN
jgi:hypothetical protein